MREILAGDGFYKAVKELKLEAIQTYSSRYDNIFQVWCVSDEAYEQMCAIREEDWKDEWGWWRYATGTNLEDDGREIKTFKVNGISMLGFHADKSRKKTYENLFRYICDGIGASTAKNVCAISVGLAKLNDISLTQLWSEYQG